MHYTLISLHKIPVQRSAHIPMHELATYVRAFCAPFCSSLVHGMSAQGATCLAVMEQRHLHQSVNCDGDVYAKKAIASKQQLHNASSQDRVVVTPSHMHLVPQQSYRACFSGTSASTLMLKFSRGAHI